MVMSSFYDLLDTSRFAELSALFAADGTWRRQGKVHTGPAEILQAMQDRSPTLVTRHVMCNARTIDGEEIRVSSSILVVSHPDGTGRAGPLKVNGPHSLVDSVAILVRGEGGLRIRSLEHRPIFLFEQPEERQ